MTLTPEVLTALCERSMPDERLTVPELDRLCFGEADSQLGDERGAAIVQRQTFGASTVSWLTLLAVAPEAQGRGIGKELLDAAIDHARADGASMLLLASAVPRYLWPGVDLLNTRANMLLESFGFVRDGVAANMAIDTTFRHEPPPGILIELETGTGAHEFCEQAYAYWVPELDLAVEQETAFAARAADGATVAFGCHSVNRAGWIGPMGTDPTRQHGGVGSAIVGALCADLAARDISTGEISWVSNYRFYGKCGAHVSRVFEGGRLAL